MNLSQIFFILWWPITLPYWLFLEVRKRRVAAILMLWPIMPRRVRLWAFLHDE